MIELREYPGRYGESYAVVEPWHWFWIQGPITAAWDKTTESGYVGNPGQPYPANSHIVLSFPSNVSQKFIALIFEDRKLY